MGNVGWYHIHLEPNNPTKDDPLNLEREREGEESDKNYQMIKKLDGNNRGEINLNVVF